MVHSIRLKSIVGLLGITLGVTVGSAAVASSYYWDTNGASSGIGSAGGSAAAWLTNSWAPSSSGTAATGTWPNTQPDNADEAVFMGTAGTVSIGADVYANALRFQTNNYTIGSTGGALHLAGVDPTITVNLASSNQVVTISAPIVGSSGMMLAGNSLTGGNKFLVLANTDAATPNSFSGPLTIEAGGALRLGGGVLREQIPDDVDLDVSGVIDFITSGGASDGKQEKVRNVTVSGSVANFSIGNEADFIVNSISADSNGAGQGIAINGNNGLAPEPHAPGRLIINGWADGAGHLTLDGGRVRINVTSSSFAVGGRVLLSGNIYSRGGSEIWNHNGGPITPEDHAFTNKALDFTAAAHTIDVADGTLTFTSRAANQPLDVTATNPGGTTLTKTGAGVWLYEHAVQTSFAGTNRVEEGTLRLGADDRLANGANLEVAGGVFDMQSFAERVSHVLLDGGTIVGTGAARLIGTQFEVRSGVANVRLDGAANLTKSTGGTVELLGANTYSGDTTLQAGTLRIAHGSLANAADVYLASGATFDLDFDAIDTIDSLFFDGVSQAEGTWGRLGHPTATNKSALFTGSGMLQVTNFVQPPLLIGDYNSNGIVDAADYTVWRNNLGSATVLANRDPLNGGDVSADDYNSWKANFGAVLPGAGTGAGGGLGSDAVPEPAGWVVGAIALVGFICRRRADAAVACRPCSASSFVTPSKGTTENRGPLVRGGPHIHRR